MPICRCWKECHCGAVAWVVDTERRRKANLLLIEEASSEDSVPVGESGMRVHRGVRHPDEMVDK